ncbi:MAG TPA: hypothetical protein VF607_15045 [Verrucomicrobiae bacterium]
MSRFRRQRQIGWLGLGLSGGAALWLHTHYRHLPDYAYLSGWALLGGMIVLTLYNIRKKLPFLPLGNSESWLQVHIYLGWFTTLLFLIHLNFRLPQGWFEGCLAWLFVLVSGSGMVGLFFSRVLPRRLATRGGEVIFEKIPGLRQQLKTTAEELALGREARSPVLADFYARRLAPFFGGPRHFWKHLAESRRPVGLLLAELNDLQRFAAEPERPRLAQLVELVRQKDNLDYHRALQLSLKLWLFVHIPLTYGLLIFTLWHVVLVFAFSGGAR